MDAMNYVCISDVQVAYSCCIVHGTRRFGDGAMTSIMFLWGYLDN